MLHCLPHEVVEHWRGRTIYHGGLGRQCHCTCASFACGNLTLALHPGDGACRNGCRCSLGIHPWLSEGKVQCKRDHQYVDVELCRDFVGELLGVRSMDRGW